MNDLTNRRGFLGGLSDLGLVGSAKVAKSSDSQPDTVPKFQRLRNIAKTVILRNETIQLPEGTTEHFHEWLASDDTGATQKHLVHSIKQMVGETYTVSTNVHIHYFAPGRSTESTPTATKSQSFSVVGQKGPVVGTVRHDEIAATTILLTVVRLE